MFIFTAKINQKKEVAGLLALAVLCGGLWGLDHTLLHPESAPAMASSTKGIKSNEDRIVFLSGYGWEVSQDPLSTEELLIPKEFDDSYTDYLALQSEQGFDLTKYQGKRVKRYTYEVLNYPSGEEGVQVSLLIYRNTVIGGEVFTTSLDGFMHGLAMPG